MRRPRISIDVGDIPASTAARRMGLSESDFAVALPELLLRGFPAPDTTTGNFDLQAIDAWRRLRHRHLFDDLPGAVGSEDFLMRRIGQELGHG